MRVSRQVLTLGAACVTMLSLVASPFVSSSHAAAAAGPQAIDDSQLQARFTTIGGADVVSTTQTIPHWHGQSLDPHNGVTYGYNMVGANPNTCTGAGCSTTIEADITPLIVNVGGRTYDGTDVVAATLASPIFALNDYGSTQGATVAGGWPNTAPIFVRGAGGTLSQGDAGNQLQLEDATMRAQFNQTGSSLYHLKLHPNVLPPVVIDVPQSQGTLLQTSRGIVFADVNIGWWGTQIANLNSQADPTHLPIYLTDDVMLYFGGNPFDCCAAGYHGTKTVGRGPGASGSQGNALVQTFVWASYTRPGMFAGRYHGSWWAEQDIFSVSHEISEWADDPFVTNFVEPWSDPIFGFCSPVLETGDPVPVWGFAMGTNPYLQGPDPDGTQTADGYYHPEDEVFLPWFMRMAPNTISEPTQSPSANGGRYTLMGDLNSYPGFQGPAPSC